MLVLNVSGTRMMNDGSILALTTLGNLGTPDVEYIDIPGCDSTKYQLEQCRLSKSIPQTLGVIQTVFFMYLIADL